MLNKFCQSTRVRGVNWEGSIRDKIPAFRRLMLPLIFRILDHVDGQSLAIDNRGGVRSTKENPAVAADVPAVAMQNVHVRYDAAANPDDKHALTAMSLEIEQGGAIVLLAASAPAKQAPSCCVRGSFRTASAG